MTNLSLVTRTGTGIGSFNPHRLGGIASILHAECELRKANVRSLHSAIESHNAITHQYINVYQHAFLVDLGVALKRVDADLWVKLYDETNLGNFMDTESYNSHKKSLADLDNVIPFSMENVVNQLEMFVGEIDKILIKRVVAIFEKLSPDHITNSAYGFRNRMIINNCSRSYNEYGKSRYIHDLRCVLSMMRGEAEMPDTSATASILEHCFTHYGKWQMLDGNSLRIKAFKKGTVHIEIDTNLADKLNAVLAAEFPNCLPEAGTKKPLFKSALSPVDVMLNNGVRNEMRRVQIEHPLKMREGGRDQFYRDKDEYEIRLYCYQKKTNPVTVEAINLLTALYGEPREQSTDYIWKLGNHNPKETINHLLIVGSMPEEASHQFYESTERVQEHVDSLLSIDQGESVCEPSAGRGALAKLLPADQTTCFEINSLNCTVLRGLGYETKQECFLNYANKTSDLYDWIVMNPPYTKNMYWTHIKAAMKLLKPGGRIVAVVPCSIIGKADELPHNISMTENYRLEEQFKGTGKLTISIVTLEKSSVF